MYSSGITDNGVAMVRRFRIFTVFGYDCIT